MRIRIAVPTLVAVLCLLAVPQRGGAEVQFFDDEVLWMNAVTGPIQSLDLFDANVVALSNEVATVPSPGDFLGTNILTFDTVNTGLNEQFVLEMLEASDIQFQDSSAARPGLEPEGDIREEDFEQRIGGSGVLAIGWNLVQFEEPAVSLWEVFDGSDNLLGSIAPVPDPLIQFVGVVSDTPIVRARFTHSGPDNIAVGTHHFSFVPEPSSITLAAIAVLAYLGRVRSISRH